LSDFALAIDQNVLWFLTFVTSGIRARSSEDLRSFLITSLILALQKIRKLQSGGNKINKVKLQTLRRQYELLIEGYCKIKIKELQSSLKAYEMRLLDRNPIKNEEQALKVHHSRNDEKKKHKKWKGKCTKGSWKADKVKDDQDDKPISVEKSERSEKSYQKKDKRSVECFNCHNYEHYSYKCYADKSKRKKYQGKEAYIGQEDSDLEPLILMVTTYAENSNCQADLWYLDSGCSNHMTCHKEWLINFYATKKSKVKFANDNTLKVEGIEDVVIRRKNGSHAIIISVLFVPAMKCNLFNIGQLVQRGFTVVMRGYNRVELNDVNKNLILRCKISKNRTF
ncbi:uncharacterized protein LOC124837082, partial [Vigna umbellata]|uniref:uncharacterized protein LOC124837082 n=1 Tax=Vigna umbellata TaxID=87088 RepID=UPI001F5FBCD2